MGEIELLKAKCNTLIDKALQKKAELEELDLEIGDLQRQKDILLERLASSMNSEVENQSVVESKENEKEEENIDSQEKFTSCYNQTLQNINNISKQVQMPLENQQSVSRVSVNEKTKEVLLNIAGRIGKILIMVGITIVLSLVVTMVLNSDFRNMVMEILKGYIR